MRLARFVARCASSVPFYRQLFAEYEENRRRVRSPADLEGLPVTTRALLQETTPADRLAGTWSRRSGRLHPRATSGSTGQPLVMLRSRADLLRRAIQYAEVLLRAGAPLFGARVFIGPHGGSERRSSWWKRWARLGMWSLSAYAPPEALAAEVARIRPRTVIAYASALHAVAIQLRRKGHRVDSVRRIFTFADVLSPECVEATREVFGIGPSDLYSTVECGGIAWQCRPGGSYHLCERSSVVELEPVNPASPAGEDWIARPVVTPLHYRAMPLVRYLVEDEVVVAGEPCDCGRPGTVLRQIRGRSSVYLVGHEGRVTTGLILTGFLGYVPGLLRYRAENPEPGLLRVRFVGDDLSPEHLKDEIARNVCEVAGLDLSVEVIRASGDEHFKCGVFSPFRSPKGDLNE